MPDTRPTQTFHTNVFGDRANVTVGAGVVFASQVAPEEDLFAVLRREGIGDDALEELRAALRADQAAEPDADEPWPRVRAWMTKWLGRTGSVAGKIGIGASGGLVAHAIESDLQSL